MRDRRRKPDQDLPNLRGLMIMFIVLFIGILMLMEKIFHTKLAFYLIPALLGFAILLCVLEICHYVCECGWPRRKLNQFKTWIRWPV